MSAASVLVTVICALLFLATAAGKLTGYAASLEIRDHLAIPALRWQQIGLLEVAGALGVLIGLALRPLGIAAAAGLVLLSLGAIATHVRAGDKPAAALPAVAALALAAAALVLQGTDA
jgi:DoxX-like protein